MMDEQKCFGIEVGWVLTEDETPLEVLGCVKYLDADGRPQHWVFQSTDLTAVEAAGMAKFIETQTSDDLETHMYVTVDRSRSNFEADDEDDDA